MEVEYCDIVYNDSKNRMSLSLNLDTEHTKDLYSLENIITRIEIFTNRFKNHSPDWARVKGEYEIQPNKTIYQYEYTVFEGSVDMPNRTSLCDLTITQERNEMLGTTVEATFDYNISDTEDLHSYYKMLSLFCRFCFNVDFNYSKPILDKLDNFWPNLINILDYRKEQIEDIIDEIISSSCEDKTPSECKDLVSRPRNYPVVIYKRTRDKIAKDYDVDSLFVKLFIDTLE